MEMKEGEDVIKEGGEEAGEGYKEGVSVALSKRNNISRQILLSWKEHKWAAQ